jgi:hypothetical protein
MDINVLYHNEPWPSLVRGAKDRWGIRPLHYVIRRIEGRINPSTPLKSTGGSPDARDAEIQVQETGIDPAIK